MPRGEDTEKLSQLRRIQRRWKQLVISVSKIEAPALAGSIGWPVARFATPSLGRDLRVIRPVTRCEGGRADLFAGRRFDSRDAARGSGHRRRVIPLLLERADATLEKLLKRGCLCGAGQGQTLVCKADSRVEVRAQILNELGEFYRVRSV